LISLLARIDESNDARRILITVPQWLDSGQGRQDVLTLLDWPQWRMSYYPTISIKDALSWHWTGHSGVTGSKRSYTLKWCKLNN